MSATAQHSSPKTPLTAGLTAARANIVPGLIIQSLMLAVVLAYYLSPTVQRWLGAVAEVKARLGYCFSVPSAIVAGAVIPEIVAILFVQHGRPRRENLHNLLFTTVYWGFSGFFVDTLYRAQATLFGSHATFVVVLKKVLVDQFVYNPIFAAPLIVIAYDWKNAGYSSQAFRAALQPGFYVNRIVPALLATWGVWIPLVSLIYALPSLLQVPLFSLALSLWVMLYTTMSKIRD